MELNDSNAHIIPMIFSFIYYFLYNYYKNRLTDEYLIRLTIRIVYTSITFNCTYGQSFLYSIGYFIFSWYMFIFNGISI